MRRIAILSAIARGSAGLCPSWAATEAHFAKLPLSWLEGRVTVNYPVRQS